MMLGMPVAFAFLLVSVVAAFFVWGGETGLRALINSLSVSVTVFTLLPLPLFVLMGEVLFHSQAAPLMIDTLDKWLGRLPGRLSLEAVVGGTLISTLTGASISSVAMLGSVLIPEMEKRGYKKPMTLGPIVGSGGLATMIPPSGLGVLLAAVGLLSIGRMLIAIIIPGLLMAFFYAGYVVIRCRLQPSIAPVYEIPHTPLSEKLIDTLRYILPVGFVVFLVTGFIFLGIATPTEAAACGSVGAFILAVYYRRLNWEVVKKAVLASIGITGMMFIILAGATSFSELLAFSGASRGLSQFFISLPVAPVLIIVAMEFVILILGMFMNTGPVIMITVPLFMPVVKALGFNPLWFGVITLLNVEMALTTPPFGMNLFVMKGVAPPGTTLGDIIRAGLPFLGCDLITMVLLFAFPQLTLWLPALMRG